VLSTLFFPSNTGYLPGCNVRLSEIMWIWDKSRTVFHLDSLSCSVGSVKMRDDFCFDFFYIYIGKIDNNHCLNFFFITYIIISTCVKKMYKMYESHSSVLQN
jgi:hypothetical protein